MNRTSYLLYFSPIFFLSTVLHPSYILPSHSSCLIPFLSHLPSFQQSKQHEASQPFLPPSSSSLWDVDRMSIFHCLQMRMQIYSTSYELRKLITDFLQVTYEWQATTNVLPITSLIRICSGMWGSKVSLSLSTEIPKLFQALSSFSHLSHIRSTFNHHCHSVNIITVTLSPSLSPRHHHHHPTHYVSSVGE